jgi:hypothetical protein
LALDVQAGRVVHAHKGLGAAEQEFVEISRQHSRDHFFDRLVGRNRGLHAALLINKARYVMFKLPG